MQKENPQRQSNHNPATPTCEHRQGHKATLCSLGPEIPVKTHNHPKESVYIINTHIKGKHYWLQVFSSWSAVKATVEMKYPNDCPTVLHVDAYPICALDEIICVAFFLACQRRTFGLDNIVNAHPSTAMSYFNTCTHKFGISFRHCCCHRYLSRHEEK